MTETNNNPKAIKPTLLFSKYETAAPVAIIKNTTGPKQHMITAIGTNNMTLGNLLSDCRTLITYKIKNVIKGIIC